jgi:hypothetical protein
MSNITPNPAPIFNHAEDGTLVHSDPAGIVAPQMASELFDVVSHDDQPRLAESGIVGMDAGFATFPVRRAGKVDPAGKR